MCSFNSKNGFRTARLILETGEVFEGESIGSTGFTSGELIFNTGMFGYQETLSDPSYYGQIITFTTPHVGSVGVTRLDNESERIWAAGVVMKKLSKHYSNWRASHSLDEFLKRNNIVGVSNIDVRQLVRKIREYGSINCSIVTEESSHSSNTYFNQQRSIKKQVLSKSNKKLLAASNLKYNVVVYDFGAKDSILEQLKHKGCNIYLTPCNTTISEILHYKPDGVLLSNGPGDPMEYKESIFITKQLLDLNIPVFGICLGHQILGLACGAQIQKMPNGGHHGTNHPVLHLISKEVAITSQNHSFTLNEQHFPPCIKITHRSLFDNSIQGIEHVSKPAFGFQGHPEASPGPHDLRGMFDKFIEIMAQNKKIEVNSIKAEMNA